MRALAKRPRVCVITTAIETFEQILGSQISSISSDFDVTVISSSKVRLQHYALSQGVRARTVSMVRGISPIADFISVILMVCALARERPDIVHSYTPKAGLVSALAGWITRRKVRIHTFTGLLFPTERGFRRFLLINVDRLICWLSTHVVPEGEGVRNDLLTNRVCQSVLRPIGNGNIAGVDTNHFDSRDPDLLQKARDIRSRMGAQETEFAFLYVGRLNRDKGISELLLAFQRLAGRAWLIIVGDLDRSAPISQGDMEVIAQNPNIRWLGHQDDVRPAMGAANILILPSYREGFPNVVLQAGAMRLPCIVTDVNGSREAIIDGSTGWIIPPRNVDGLAASMQNAMDSDRSRLVEMGTRARSMVAERFEATVYRSKLRDFYHSTLINSPHAKCRSPSVTG